MPAAAYDWPMHKAMEVAAVGHPFDGYFGWHYPPTFLFVAAGAGAGCLTWRPISSGSVVTFPAYLVAIRAIVGDRVGYLLAAAFPAVLCNFIVGQNGFLTAALIGGALVMLVERPILAGVLHRTADLQAASRPVVSDRAGGGRALARLRRGRRSSPC